VRDLLVQRIRLLLHRRRQARLHGTPEAIHDVRVATRRLQEVLDLFAPALPEKERERLRRRARRIRKSLAEVRDVDVLVDVVGRLRADPTRRASRGLAALERKLLMSAAGLRHGLGLFARPATERGRGLRIGGIRKRATALLALPVASTDSRTEAAAQRFASARAREVRAALPAARRGRAEALHRLRVAVKRYRYCLETLEAWGRGPLEDEIARARGIQEKLGAVHDLDVLIEMARDTPGLAVRRLLRRDRRRLSARARRAIEGFRPFVPRIVPLAAPVESRPALRQAL
jgi:CHAD domain-containing protein